MKQLTEALWVMNRLKVSHRDIKPMNVLVFAVDPIKVVSVFEQLSVYVWMIGRSIKKFTRK